MISRQAILEAFYLKPFPVNQTDDINLCATINQESIKYALNNSALATLKRYLKIGKQLKIVDDIKESTGIQWILSELVNNIKFLFSSINWYILIYNHYRFFLYRNGPFSRFTAQFKRILEPDKFFQLKRTVKAVLYE